jgi:hypothetical protein
MAGVPEMANTPLPQLGYLNTEANDVEERMAKLLASWLGQWCGGGRARWWRSSDGTGARLLPWREKERDRCRGEGESGVSELDGFVATQGHAWLLPWGR